MQLTRPVAARVASFILLIGSVLAGCGVVQPPADKPTASSTRVEPAESGPSLTVAPSPMVSPSESPIPSPSTAEVACSAILDNIPLVIVKSGRATLAAAFEVTGAQLTSYFVKTLNADPTQTNGSDWWDQPTKLVDMCLYDGDFRTMTPGPSGHDTSATRVLVVISDGDAQFWASTLNNAAIPATDPATMSQ